MSSFKREIRDTELFPLEVGLWIRDHVEGRGNKDLAAAVNEMFGTSYTIEQIRAFKKNHRLASGLTGHASSKSNFLFGIMSFLFFYIVLNDTVF